jgi:NitT/TauT family transport system substrate-binding protein
MFGWKAAIASALVLAVGSNSVMAADTLRVRLAFTPWGISAAYLLAEKKGWYKEHNLDVKVDDGNGSVATVQIVGNGEYDVGEASLAVVAMGRSKGLPIKAIAGFTRQNDIGLIVGNDTGINTPADLRGKKLAFTAGSLETPFLDLFLAAGKLTRSDVELVNIDAASKGGTYMTGRVDGVFSASTFLLPIANQHRPSKAIRFSDYGLEFPSSGLFATEAKLAEKGDAIRRFASVTSGAWAYIFAGRQDEAVQALLEGRPQAKLNPVVNREQINMLQEYMSTPATRDLPVGVMAASDWEKSIAVLRSVGLIEGSRRPDEFFADNFVDLKILKDIAGRR